MSIASAPAVNTDVNVTAILPAITRSRANNTRRVLRAQAASAIHDNPIALIAPKATCVRTGSDGSVGSGLVQAWRAWDPSGAIAQRSQRSKQLLDETNQIWKDTSEFRAAQADRQSRDVGCLLQGYYDVEDNSRKYDLPPLPCGQEYGPGN